VLHRSATLAAVPHEFIHQPYDDGYDLRDFFDDVVAEPAYETLAIVVAWVKRSGVDSLRTSIEELRQRGVALTAVVGISQGGTSRQGLDALYNLVDRAYVFHQPGRTFHPKLYLAHGDSSALVLVGSHNLTAGGAAQNFEAGTLSTLDLSVADERSYFDSVRSFVDALISDHTVCKPLDDDLLDRLRQSSRYRLSDEDSPITGSAEPMEDPASASDERAEGGDDDPPLFGRSGRRLRSITYTSSKPAASLGTGGSPGGAQPPPSGTAAGPAPATPATSAGPAGGPAPSAPTAPPGPASGAASVLRRWYKELGSIDAQQGSSPDWHASNTMTLVQAGHNIPAQTYFRTTFFGNQSWVQSQTRGPNPKAREVTTIRCEVIANGVSRGMHEFEIRHTPDYESQQSNRVTELRWGDISQYMKSVSHVGHYATLEQLSDGTYRLFLQPTPAGAFIR
jgi:hypothetical protein